MADDDDGKWHLDKRVPIGLIIAVAVNALTGIWYASKLDSRVSVLENDGAKATITEEKLTEITHTLDNRLIHVEDNTNSVLEIVRRAEDRQSETSPRRKGGLFDPHEP